MELKEILKDKELTKKLLLSHVLVLFIGITIGSIVFSSRCTESIKGTSITDLKQSSLLEKVIDNSQCDLYVEVAGAVNNPGVYCFQNGDMIVNAIEKAGGFNMSVYAFKYISREINLSEILQENYKLYVPFEDDLQCQLLSFTLEQGVNSRSDVDILGTAKVKGGNDCINLNEAISTELTNIPGVGLSTAVKIIDGRPYGSIEDIMNVSGIGESTFEKMKGNICI